MLRVYWYVCNSWFRERTKAAQLMAKRNKMLVSELNLFVDTLMACGSNYGNELLSYIKIGSAATVSFSRNSQFPFG
jgi:hypothetical protein